MDKKKKILIAESSGKTAKDILSHKRAKEFEIEICEEGTRCLELIEKFKPDLLLVQLLLPGIHGIEILRHIRSSSFLEDMGVILLATLPMLQNYHAALNYNADYFLKDPFDAPFFFELVDKFFQGKLRIEPYSPRKLNSAGQTCYVPPPRPQDVYLKFWGTRGSIPVSDANYVRFGGNTSCLELRHNDTTIVIDAGTGIRQLGNQLITSSNKELHLFIGHTHWDHVAGFPFFIPIYDPSFTVHIWAPIGFEKNTRELFTEMLAFAYFPVRLEDISAKLIFHDLIEQKPIKVGAIEITSHYAYHPGATLCFKFKIKGKTIGYVTDNELFMGYHGDPNAITYDHPIMRPHRSLIDFFQGVDILIHEAQYTPKEYMSKEGWGHSSITNAAALIKLTKAKEWIVTHHDPAHTDQLIQKKIQGHLDALEACKVSCAMRFAYDSFMLNL